MSRPLDAKDAALLDLLAADARTPTAALARAVGLSRSAVQERIARLEREGVIAGYTLVRGRPAARAPYLAHVLLSIDARQNDRALLALKAIPEIKRCQTVSGEYDALLTVEAATAEALDSLLDEIGRLPGVKRTNSAIALATKFER